MYVILLLLAFPILTTGQTRDLSAYEGKPRVRVVQLNADERISLDGNLEENAWQNRTAFSVCNRVFDGFAVRAM
jgi:hypothetical protein